MKRTSVVAGLLVLSALALGAGLRAQDVPGPQLVPLPLSIEVVRVVHQDTAGIAGRSGAVSGRWLAVVVDVTSPSAGLAVGLSYLTGRSGSDLIAPTGITGDTALGGAVFRPYDAEQRAVEGQGLGDVSAHGIWQAFRRSDGAYGGVAYLSVAGRPRFLLTSELYLVFENAGHTRLALLFDEGSGQGPYTLHVGQATAPVGVEAPRRSAPAQLVVAGVFLFVLDLAAVMATGLLATKLADRDLPTFVKQLIGAVSGIPVELVRVAVAYVLTSLLLAPGTVHAEVLAFLIGFRVVRIPVLVGIGFLAGGAAGQKNVKCPACGKPVAVNAADARGPERQGVSIAPPAEGVAPHRQECPHCKATILIDPKTLKVVGHEPAATPEPVGSSTKAP